MNDCMCDPVWEDHSGASTQKASRFTTENFSVTDITEQNTKSKSITDPKDRMKKNGLEKSR